MCSTSFVGGRYLQKLIWMDTQGCLTHIVEIFKFGDVSGPRATKWPRAKGWGRCLGRRKGQEWRGKGVGWWIGSRGWGRDPQKLIWIDTQGSLTHIVKIFKFGNVSGPRAAKWPKVNQRLKIVNYYTHVQHFFCRWLETPRSWFELIPKDL